MANERTARFRELHRAGRILRLANVWGLASAKLIERAGASAIATTSAGVAWALGYGDGYRLPVGDAIGLAARLAQAVNVPLTIDIENGYSEVPSMVGDMVVQLATVRVAGINIEDSSKPADMLERKIGAIKDAIHRRGLDVFINARIHVYLNQLGPPPEMLAEALVRAKKYAEAGADGIFVPGLTQSEHITRLVENTALPLNLMVSDGLPDAARLEHLGVRRLSTGSAIAQVAYRHTQQTAREFLETGQIGNPKGPVSYSQMQRLFA
jgi:2-methylisocitrate lyase-like PEP mutase family enzyme